MIPPPSSRTPGIALALMLAWAAPTAAQLRVIDVSPRVAARGVDLSAGDVLLGPGGSALDAAALRRLEAVDAQRGGVPLVRRRGSADAPIELPAGAWLLELLPAADAATDARVVEARRGRDLAPLDAWIAARTDAASRAEGLLLRARWQARAGRWDEADRDAAQARALAPALAADFDEQYLRALDARSDRRPALAVAERLVGAREADDDEARRAIAWLLRSRARALLRDNAGAKDDAQRALEAGRGLTRALAEAQLGFIALRAADRESAFAQLGAARDAIARIAPGSAELGAVLGHLATAASLTGDARAEEHFEDALAVLRTVAPGEIARGSIAFNAHLHMMGRKRLARAEDYAREALEVFDRAAPGSLFQSQARTAVADVLMRRTQYEEAEAVFRIALDTATRIDPVGYEALSTRVQIAQALVGQWRLDEAHAAVDAVLANIAGAPADAPVRRTALEADSRALRGTLRAQLGDLAGAEADAIEAAAYYEGTGIGALQYADLLLLRTTIAWQRGDGPAAESFASQALQRYTAGRAEGIEAGRARFELGRALALQGRIDEALAQFLAAIDALEQHRDEIGGSADVRARWAAQYQDFYREPLRILAGRGDLGGTLDLEHRYRIGALLRLLDPERERPADWAAAGARADPARALAADQALVSFVATGDHVVALVWPGPAQPPVLRLLDAPAGGLDAAIARLRLFAARAPDDDSLAALDAAAAPLRAALVDPLLPLIGERTRWVIAGDGPLRELPWAALPMSTGDDPPRLIERHAIALTPSPAVFARGMPPTAGDRVVAFAGIAADRAPVVARHSAVDLTAALPGARRELDAIGETYGALAERLTGDAATEAAARERAAVAGVLHFAVHGVLDARDPMDSFLALSRGRGTPDDDGRLSAAEVAADLRLPGSLVVLSSCESARGTDAGGEGLLGLSRALGVAGARGVVGTLWRVADSPTALLMADFHRALRAGASADVALARSQRAWLARARAAGAWETVLRAVGAEDALPAAASHPFHWAGFAVDGG
jgi:CHAT domain-containing protein